MTIEVLKEILDVAGDLFVAVCHDDEHEFFFVSGPFDPVPDSLDSLGDALIALGHVTNGRPERISELSERKDLGFFIPVISKVVGPFGAAYAIEYFQRSPRAYLSYVYWNGTVLPCESTSSALENAHALTHNEQSPSEGLTRKR